MTDSGPAGVIAQYGYAYDGAGNLTQKVGPTGTWTYGYNADAELTGAQLTNAPFDAGGQWSVSGAVASGPQAGLSGSGTMVVDQVYGSAQFTGSFSFQTSAGAVSGTIQDGTVNGSTLQLLAVVGTVQDQVTIDLATATVTQMAGTWHDSLGNTGTMSATRLGAAPVQGLQYAYAYDAAGNRTQETVNGQTTTYSYNAANELTQVVTPTGTGTYSYDAAGNETSNGTDTYSYDGLGQLTGAVTSSGSYTYEYSGNGLRYEKTGSAGSTRYYWAQGETLTETNAAGTVTADNLYGLNLLARTAGGATGFYLYDGHGDVVDVASGSTILDSYRYDPFGNIISQTGSFSNPYLYAGEPYDPETGNYYLESRYYDPATGRFLTPDTLAGNPADPLNLDLYVYVDNNPLTRIDPTGHTSYVVEVIEAEMVVNSQQWESAPKGPASEIGTRAWLHEQNIQLAKKLRGFGVSTACNYSGCYVRGVQNGAWYASPGGYWPQPVQLTGLAGFLHAVLEESPDIVDWFEQFGPGLFPAYGSNNSGLL